MNRATRTKAAKIIGDVRQLLEPLTYSDDIVRYKPREGGEYALLGFDALRDTATAIVNGAIAVRVRGNAETAIAGLNWLLAMLEHEEQEERFMERVRVDNMPPPMTGEALQSRVDLERYSVGVERLTNFIPEGKICSRHPRYVVKPFCPDCRIEEERKRGAASINDAGGVVHTGTVKK